MFDDSNNTIPADVADANDISFYVSGSKGKGREPIRWELIANVKEQFPECLRVTDGNGSLPEVVWDNRLFDSYCAKFGVPLGYDYDLTIEN